MAEELISVAKLRKPHKVSGAFRFMFLRELKNAKKFPPHFQIEIKGQPTPFFVKAIEVLNMEEGIIQFEEITTPEQAKAYNGKELMLEQKTVVKYFKPDSDYYSFLIGYTLLNAEGKRVGEVVDVQETAMQVFVEVNTGDSEALIPLTDDWILEVDKKGRKLVMDFPEELLHL